MIPQELILKNFLSYRQAKLNFAGLHTACICGPNGAGKSSLLEAITWVIWGRTRTASEEDLINKGAKDVRVDFKFSYNYQTYRVIRTRKLKGGATLDFQIEHDGNFKSISGKGIRETQKLIIANLRLDYDTFINSAYLRQGKADEFMIRTPSERKKVLVELLKLNQYEDLAVKAKDFAKNLKGKIEELEANLEGINNKLKERDAIDFELINTTKDLKFLQDIQQKEQEKLQELRKVAHQKESQEEKLKFKENQYNSFQKKCNQIREERANIQAQLTELKMIIDDGENINLGYQQLQKLQQDEVDFREKFQIYQDVLQQKQNLEEQLRQEGNDLTLAIQREKTNLENLENKEQDLLIILKDKEQIQSDLEQLYHYRKTLNQLDDIQHEVAPLQQSRLNLCAEIEREKTKLNAKLEQLQGEEIKLNQELVKLSEKRKKFFNIEEQIKVLDNKYNYRERVKEKGLERKNLKEKCEQNKANLTEQLEKLETKLNTLRKEQAKCPLCEQNLDENHLNYVIEKTLKEKQDFEFQCHQYEEEIANYERKINQLREEYRILDKELSVYDDLKKQYIQLEEQLNTMEENSFYLQNVSDKKNMIENQLALGDYALDLQNQLRILDEKIEKLNYDEKTHSLVREEEKRWRKTEFKKVKIDDAEKLFKQIQQEKPLKLEQITNLETQLQELSKSSHLQVEINNKQAYLEEVNYDVNEHNKIREELKKAEIYQVKYFDLQQAEKQYPSLESKLNQLGEDLISSEEEKALIDKDLIIIKTELENSVDYSQDIQNLELQCEERRQDIDEKLTKKGGLTQSLTNLDSLKSEYEKIDNRLQEIRKKYRVYNELGIAFGKNGIQALMIENILPQLENEANLILARLTGNQLHVQFHTQKQKAKTSKKSSNKFKDTLEINISDSKGTRSYETYSGGESFRINFSIRLALAKILTQISGTSLQFLIVDEGFGTQDSQGCDRLIAALNAMANDFVCILIITHMPQFKEAFQTRIEVLKTNEGSQLKLST